MRRWGKALLDADVELIVQAEALGLDEHLMGFRGGMEDTTVCEVLGCASAFHAKEASR